MLNEIGPIWRSVRRHRALPLLVAEVAIGFFIIGNLEMTILWYSRKTLPPSGHREDDVVEVTSRRVMTSPEAEARLGALRARERAALEALPGVRAVAPVSSTQLDDTWAVPAVFWGAPGAASGPSRCEGVARTDDGVVIGWPIATTPNLADVVDLRFVAGGRTLATGDTVVVTRCLADAVFGAAPALGQTLYSNRRPSARIAGIVEDVSLRMPILYQAHLDALYPLPDDDLRLARYLVRTAPGRADGVRAAIAPALAALDPAARRDQLVVARLFRIEGTHAAGIAHGTAVILSVVGGMLGLLAVLGNFAVAAFLVGDRQRVIGVRRALGATRWDIFRYLLIENLLPTQLGNLLGLVLLLAMMPAARARFVGISFGPTDALATAGLLTLGGVLAKLLPSLRATRVPPSLVTRSL